MPMVDPRAHSTRCLLPALGSAALHAAWNLLLAGRETSRRRRGDLRALGRVRAPFAVDLVERGAVGLALRARLDAARDGLRRRRSRTPTAIGDASFVYPLTRARAGLALAAATACARPRRLGVPRRRRAARRGGVVLVRGPEGSGDARALLASGDDRRLDRRPTRSSTGPESRHAGALALLRPARRAGLVSAVAGRRGATWRWSTLTAAAAGARLRPPRFLHSAWLLAQFGADPRARDPPCGPLRRGRVSRCVLRRAMSRSSDPGSSCALGAARSSRSRTPGNALREQADEQRAGRPTTFR